MREFFTKLLPVTFLLSLIFFSCTKESNCTVKEIYTGNEEIEEISVTASSTVLQIKKNYIVVLECL